MKKYTFLLDRLWVSLGENNVAQYFLKDIEGKDISINDLVGHKIVINYLNEKRCAICGNKTTEVYKFGTCEKCYRTEPNLDLCMMKPELCRYNQGKCRDEKYAKEFCFQPQTLYFSVTNDLKVGYTTEPIRRWIQQGASKAIKFAVLPSRKEVGMLEFRLSRTMQDKTNWAKMLKGEFIDYDLKKVKNEKKKLLEKDYGKYFSEDDRVCEIKYPILKLAEKTSQIKIENVVNYVGNLNGIKAEYLIFDEGVLNMATHRGLLVEILDLGPAEVIKEEKAQESLF